MKDLQSFNGRVAKQNAFPLLLILIAGLITYSNTLHAPFHLDEEIYIRDNLFVRDISGALAASRADSEIYKTIVQRYVGYVSFALNYMLHGDQVEGYHAVNVTIHILNGVLVYLLLFLTFQTALLAGSVLSEHSRTVALLAGLLFVVHPVQTEAITYIMQRLASLAAFFSLLSLVLYIRWRLPGAGRQPAHAGRGQDSLQNHGSLWWYVGSVVSAMLAMKTKENAFTLPLIIMAYELFFFSGDARRRIIRLLPLMATMLIIPVSTLLLLREEGMHLSKLTTGGDAVSLPWLPYLITQPRVLVTYLRLLIVPINQNFLHDYPLYHSIFAPPIVLSIGFHLVLVLAGISLLRRSGRSDPALRIIAFGILWFYVTLVVESGLVPLPIVLCEYRLYLPSVGIFLAGVTGVSLAMARIDSRTGRSVGLVLASMLLLGAGYAAYQRNGLFNDKMLLWQDTVRKSPSLATARNGLGNAYAEAGRLDDAVREYRIALELSPSHLHASYNLALAVAKQGDRDGALRIYRELLNRYPDALLKYYNPAFMSERDPAAFVPPGNRSPEALSDMADRFFAMGSLFERKGQLAMAIQGFTMAARLRPNLVEAHYSLGNLFMQMQDYEGSIEEYGVALRLNPGHIGARINLGGVYVQLGRYHDARRELQNVLERAPGHEDARHNLKFVEELIAQQRAQTR